MKMSAPFYEPNPEITLRFGDIICGYPSVFAAIDTGATPYFQQGVSVVVDHQAYGVVLNPCCSIRDEKLSIAILKQVGKKYYAIPRLRENPLLLNEPMLPRDAFPPEQWNNLPVEDQLHREAMGAVFVLNTVFAFAPNPLLPEYYFEVKRERKLSGHYEIDFRETSTIKSVKINKPEQPVDNIKKILQLSDESRELLRTKLIAYFNRKVD